MDFLVFILLFILGLVFIVKGGDFFVDASVWIAKISKIPKFLIGATVVSIATTLPEIFVSAIASADGKTEMATSNALGSVIANTGLVFAIAIIFLPATIKRNQLAPKGVLFLSSLVVLALFSLSGVISYYASFGLFIVFLVFIFENIKSAKRELLIKSQKVNDTKPKQKLDKKDIIINILKFVIGATGIVLGSRLIVTNGSEIARVFNVDERIIGITAVAISTSLPELVTTVTAIIKKQSSLSVGNIIGANIIDITLILPICAFVSGGALPVDVSSIVFDIAVCLIIAIIIIIPSIIKGSFKRWQGVLSLLIYILYIVLVVNI